MPHVKSLPRLSAGAFHELPPFISFYRYHHSTFWQSTQVLFGITQSGIQLQCLEPNISLAHGHSTQYSSSNRLFFHRLIAHSLLRLCLRGQRPLSHGRDRYRRHHSKEFCRVSLIPGLSVAPSALTNGCASDCCQARPWISSSVKAGAVIHFIATFSPITQRGSKSKLSTGT